MTKTHSDRSQSSKIIPMGRYTTGISPLMVRVMLVNLLAVITLAGAVLYVHQFRDELLERTIKNIELQTEIIAAALGEAAKGDDSIDPAIARPIISRLVGPTNLRALVFSTEGKVIIDSRFLSGDNRVIVDKLPDLIAQQSMMKQLENALYKAIDYFSDKEIYPLVSEKESLIATDIPEVLNALEGEQKTAIRATQNQYAYIQIAAPIQRFRRVLGALHISANTDDIEAIIRNEQLSIIRVVIYVFMITLMLSFFLGRTLATPIRVLARAAVRVRRGLGREETLPEFSHRRDEIGDLSRALSDMTRALYNQIDAVERFAADVAHELKNPLTSMRSALETMRRTKREDHKERLLAILEDDVQRLDKLISDISDASRLDAELTRAQMDPVDIQKLLQTMITAYQETACAHGPKLIFQYDEKKNHTVRGIEARLGQVWRNLIDNAVSFTPKDKNITVRLQHRGKMISIFVEDEGLGLSKGAEDKIFKRFYSERPSDHIDDIDDNKDSSNSNDTSNMAANHSGLGLAISKQVVEAHGGSIHASNRTTDGHLILGACFEVRIPCAASL